MNVGFSDVRAISCALIRRNNGYPRYSFSCFSLYTRCSEIEKDRFPNRGNINPLGTRSITELGYIGEPYSNRGPSLITLFMAGVNL